MKKSVIMIIISFLLLIIASSIYLTVSSTVFTSTNQRIEEIICPINPEVINLPNSENFKLDSGIKINYDRSKLAVYEYSDIDLVNILVNNVTIHFSGILNSRDKTSSSFSTNIIGLGELKRNLINGHEVLNDCDIYLAKNFYQNNDVPRKIKMEIMHDAELCMRREFCYRLNKIELKDLQNAQNYLYDFGPLSVRTDNNILCNVNNKQPVTSSDVSTVISSFENGTNISKDELQSTVNKLVDFGIAEMIRRMKVDNEGYMKIPNITKVVETGSFWKPDTHFEAYNGSFGDVTSLKRTKDAILSNSDMKFMVSCGFGLGNAELSFQNYKLKYGVAKIDGELSAKINGISIFAEIAVDYNQKPCKNVLQELRITELGKLKMSMTGLGPLNNLTSKLISWITKNWKTDIIKQIEKKFTNIITKHLNKFNCERFRPNY